ncbi:transglycosylase SLT domain-containing protein [Luteimonas soli]|uniref:Transglycosylase SLT domain-containing protein n=1 Tax=Luteimonas soli TaxID=1648966 RepID=A0ABV7XN63_9GAMM
MNRRHDDLNPLGRWIHRNLVAVCLIGVLVLMGCVGSCMPQPVHAAERAVPVPEVSTLYRLKIEREAARNFGLDAPVARLAAQIHQESGWRPKAASAYAQGLAQFTPATAAWLPQVCPAVGKPDPWDPDWSLRAQACYMAWLYAQVKPFRYAGGMSDCTHWNLALRSYNGGLGWIQRERLATQRAGDDANDWRDIERHRVRAGWAHKENIGYPRRILLVLEPRYLAAGWPGSAVC